MKKNQIVVLENGNGLVTKAFAKQARIFGTPEYKLWKEFVADNEGAEMEIRKVNKNTQSDKYCKNLTYKNMEEHIKTFAKNDEENKLMEEFKTKEHGQKYKSILVLQILLKYTDKDHPLSASKISDKLLKEYGILAEEHSICRDIKELQRLYSADDEDCVDEGVRIPYKIEYDGSGERGYKVIKRPCKYTDLQLLVECIHSARFISNTEEKRLFKMIKEFCSKEQYKSLNNETYLVDRSKTNNNNILSYISTINAAIKENKKIKFKYMKYTLQNREAQTPRRNGAFYTVSPFKILINEGNFYLLAYNGRQIITYRIDRMDNVMKSIELREGAEFYKDINMQDFTKRVFSMFGGEEKNVTIRFTNDLLDIVIDRFGANGAMYTPDDDKHFKIHVNVEVSNMFYSWICGFRKKATIINPPEVVEDFKIFLADINQKYESC